MHWDNSAEAAAAQIAAQRQTQLNAAVASTVGAVEPPLTLRSPPDIPQPMTAVAGTVALTASPLVTSSPAFGSPAFGQNHHLSDGAGASGTNALHAEMIKQIEALEREIDGLRKHQRRGIGHNKPPEPIEPEPLSAKELGEIKKAMAVLKKQPPVPILPGTEARAAVALLMNLGDRLRPLARATGAYLAQQADNFVTEAV